MDDVPGVPEYLTVAEFLDWTPPVGFGKHRWHLMDEKPVLMPVLHVEQALLHSEAMWTISATLKHNGSDARVGAMVGVIPDASERNLYVACIGVTHTRPARNRLMPDPVLLVEIATPENQQLVGVGVCACKLVGSVHEILVLDGTSVCATLHRRKENGEWDAPLYLFTAGRLHLRSIGIEVEIERLYRNVDLGRKSLVSHTKQQPHPGGLVRQSLASLGMSVADAAAHIGVQRAYLGDVIAGVAGINADLAVRLAAAFGLTEEKWLGLQSKHDLALVADAGNEVKRLGPAQWDDFFAAPGFDLGPREQPQAQRRPYGDYFHEDGVLRDAVDTGGPATPSLQTLHDLVKRNGAETDERLRVLADAVERLDAAQSHPRLLAPVPEVLSRERRNYTVLIEGPEGAHTVIFPDLPHLTAYGPTYKQAIALATVVVENWAMRELAAGRELPEPRDPHYIINDPKYDLVMRAGARPKLVAIRPDELRERLRASASRANRSVSGEPQGGSREVLL